MAQKRWPRGRPRCGSIRVPYRGVPGETLSRYKIALEAESGKLSEVGSPQLFETAHRSPQLRLFDLAETLWLRALRASDYAPRRSSRQQALQEALFPYHEA